MKITGLAAGLMLSLAPMAMAKEIAADSAINYLCSAERAAPAAGSQKQLVMIPGMGTGGFPIKTTKPQAQAWFNYGMQLAHAFYHDDAKAAFKRASDIDPDCAMCMWGQAWAAGPTLNYDIEADETKAAAVLADKAASLGAGESAQNRALIAALKLRYASHDAAADLAYAKALDALSRQYPGEDEIAVLTSDAWLEMSSNHDDDQGAPRAVSVLEPVLKRHPDNTAAIHFYIHATEVDGVGALALPYADRLGALAPSASHLVHMGSHTFFLVGRYEDAAVANSAAIAADGAYLRAEHDPRPQGKVMYHSHDLKFGLAGVLLSGDAPLALRLAQHASFAYPGAQTGAGAQSSLGMAYIVMGRYAPAQALAIADPGKDAPIAAALRHYARGEALAAEGDSKGVRAEAALVSAPDSAYPPDPDTKYRDGKIAVLKVARLVLTGRAAMIDGDHQGAIAAYQAAAQLQDAKLSDYETKDPPLWWYPARRSLAQALLAAGDPVRAAEEARKALKAWPLEPLTLQVLSQAEAANGDRRAARRDLALAKVGWHGGVVSGAGV